MEKRQLDMLERLIHSNHKDYIADKRLLNYRYIEVKENYLKKYSTDFEELIDGLKPENYKEVSIQCDLCKEAIPFTTWDDFDKHYRRCQKIDFIDRQAKELKGAGIDKEFYYNMGTEELDNRYRKIMDNWKQRNPNFMSILKKL